MTNSKTPGIKFLNLKIFTTLISILLLCFMSVPLPNKVLAQKGEAKDDQKAPVVVPTVPIGCADARANFSNNTPVTIDPGLANVVTSTINVVTTNTYLWDVDLTTNITHTFNSDLDITVQSPAGTVVTLTTDNAGGNDDVFNGTLWDDDADTPVSDTTFVNNITATPVVPEEALAAFVGENPNGIWTLTISDDANGDGGSATWSMDLTTFLLGPSTNTTNASNNTPENITDGTPAVSVINVAGVNNLITKATVEPFITHTFNGDIDMTLQSPAGTVVTLTTDNGGGNDDVFNGTLWDDDANPGGQVPYSSNNGVTTDQTYVNNTTATPLVPEEAMGAFLGENPNGDWTLRIVDDAGGDDGTLSNWNLNITTGACPSAAAVTVIGKVVTQSGRGIGNAYVSIVDLNGNTLSTRRSNIFGYFRFDEIPAGETYTINTSSRNHRFNPVLLDIADDIRNLVITAEN